MATKYNLLGQKIGKLQIIKLCAMEERPTKTHGNYWLCKCDCGNECKVPTAYLTGKGKYLQTSCGCDRKKKAFLATTDKDLPPDIVNKYSQTQEDFEKYLLLHKALVRTSGNGLTYYMKNIEEYKAIIQYFWTEKQFNAIYNFWKKNKNINATYYDWSKPSLDHIIPISKNGTNTLDNFQFLTTFENLSKRDMTMEEWQNFKQKTHTTSDYFIENILKGDRM